MSKSAQWIKIETDIFEDEKMLLIDSLPESDSILLIWFKLLCLAGKQNNKGVFVFNKIPYTTKMLSTIFRREEEIIDIALKKFEEYGMIQYVNKAITITNWGKHQNLDKIEANNAYMREYMREYRKKQKEIAIGKSEDKVNRKVNINSADKDKESDKDKNSDKNIDNTILSNCDNEQPPLDYQAIINSFHSTCKSLPGIIKLTDKRKKAILSVREILDGLSFEQFFEKIEDSDFLTGRNGEWRCDFDWITETKNVIKILEGKYDNRKGKSKKDYSDCTKYENMEMEI